MTIRSLLPDSLPASQKVPLTSASASLTSVKDFLTSGILTLRFIKGSLILEIGFLILRNLPLILKKDFLTSVKDPLTLKKGSLTLRIASPALKKDSLTLKNVLQRSVEVWRCFGLGFSGLKKHIPILRKVFLSSDYLPLTSGKDFLTPEKLFLTSGKDFLTSENHFPTSEKTAARKRGGSNPNIHARSPPHGQKSPNKGFY